MSRHGHRLIFDGGPIVACAESGFRYELSEEGGIAQVRCLDLDEDNPLPEDLSVGNRPYSEFRK